MVSCVTPIAIGSFPHRPPIALCHSVGRAVTVTHVDNASTNGHTWKRIDRLPARWIATSVVTVELVGSFESGEVGWKLSVWKKKKAIVWRSSSFAEDLQQWQWPKQVTGIDYTKCHVFRVCVYVCVCPVSRTVNIFSIRSVMSFEMSTGTLVAVVWSRIISMKIAKIYRYWTSKTSHDTHDLYGLLLLFFYWNRY